MRGSAFELFWGGYMVQGAPFRSKTLSTRARDCIQHASRHGASVLREKLKYYISLEPFGQKSAVRTKNRLVEDIFHNKSMILYAYFA